MKTKIDKIINILSKEVQHYKVPVIDLMKIQGNNEFKVLVATILSSRTKDSITANVSKRLFLKADSFEKLNSLNVQKIQQLIYPVGFYKTKAKNLKKLSTTMLDEYNGKIPKTIDELVKLPGVGRKTANLVMSIAFSIDAICVDTHVHRIMNRIGYISTDTPFMTEKELRKKLPKKYWKKINHIFVVFGQNLCVPISPFCSKCPIFQYCLKVNVKKSR